MISSYLLYKIAQPFRSNLQYIRGYRREAKTEPTGPAISHVFTWSQHNACSIFNETRQFALSNKGWLRK